MSSVYEEKFYESETREEYLRESRDHFQDDSTFYQYHEKVSHNGSSIGAVRMEDKSSNQGKVKIYSMSQ